MSDKNAVIRHRAAMLKKGMRGLLTKEDCVCEGNSVVWEPEVASALREFYPLSIDSMSEFAELVNRLPDTESTRYLAMLLALEIKTRVWEVKEVEA